MSFDFKPDTQEKIPEMMPPTERVSRFNILVFVAFGLLVLVWLAWQPLVKASKAGWARHHAREAMMSISGNDLPSAVPHLLTAREWAPEDVEVIRAVIEYLKVTNSDPSTLVQQLKMLSSKQALTSEEEVLLGVTLVATGKTAEARVVYDKLEPVRRGDAKVSALLSRILVAEGRTAEAAEITQRSASANTSTPEERLKHALADRDHRFLEVRRGALHQFWDLAASNGETAIGAIVALAEEPTLKLPEARRLLQMAESHPHQSMLLRLRVVSALMRLQPQSRDRILDEEVARFKDSNDGNLTDFARWLAVEKQHERLVKLLPRGLAMKSRDLYPILADALVNAGRWQELKEMLTNSRPPVSQALSSIWLAEVEAHLQPDLAESRALLQGGIESARVTKNVPALYAAAFCAEKINLPDLALVAYDAAAIDESDTSVQFLQKAWEMAVREKKADAMMSISRRLRVLRPSSGVFADRLTYLQLVLGSELETVMIPGDGPSVSSDRVPLELLRALAAYRYADKTSMLTHLQAIKNPAALPAGQRAVIAGMLSLGGKPADAFQIAEKTPENILLDEERQFLLRAR